MKASAAIAGAAAVLAFSVSPGCGNQESTLSGETVLERDVTDFHLLFQKNCSGCHGANGLNGPARCLNDAVYLALIPRGQLQSVVENGRSGTAMPAFAHNQGGPLYPNQVAALVEGIYSEWAKPVDFGGPPPPYSAGTEAGNPDHGRDLFGKVCAGCHGPEGKTGQITSPAFLSLISDQWLRSSILAGRHDLGMPDWRTLNHGDRLSDADAADLVAYLVSMRPMKNR
jgi:cytochrome c oxidase cbb3-type subunit 3